MNLKLPTDEAQTQRLLQLDGKPRGTELPGLHQGKTKSAKNCSQLLQSARGASNTHPLKAIQAAGTRGSFLFFSAKELMNRARGSAFNFPTGNAQHTNLYPQLWR